MVGIITALGSAEPRKIDGKQAGVLGKRRPHGRERIHDLRPRARQQQRPLLRATAPGIPDPHSIDHPELRLNRRGQRGVHDSFFRVSSFPLMSAAPFRPARPPCRRHTSWASSRLAGPRCPGRDHLQQPALAVRVAECGEGAGSWFGWAGDACRCSSRCGLRDTGHRAGDELLLRASIALMLLSNALLRTPLPTVPRTNPRIRPLAFLPSRTMTTSTSVIPSGSRVSV